MNNNNNWFDELLLMILAIFLTGILPDKKTTKLMIFAGIFTTLLLLFGIFLIFHK